MAESEYAKHVTGSWVVETSFGRAHFTQLDTFDPQLFLENTPRGTATDKHHMRAVHDGVSIVYSHEVFEPGTEHLMLSVSEGTTEARADIVRRFSEFLGESTGRYDWAHISSLGVYQRNMYIWKAKLTPL